MSPFNLQEEVQALQDLDTYHISNEHEIDAHDQGAIAGLLTSASSWSFVRKWLTLARAGAVEAVATSPDSITEPAVFDVYRSLLKCVRTVLLFGFGAHAACTGTRLHCKAQQ